MQFDGSDSNYYTFHVVDYTSTEILEFQAVCEHNSLQVICRLPLRTHISNRVIPDFATLSYFEDFNLNEIASLLDLPLGTVKFRLHRARKELAASLAQTFRGKAASN